jgi:hypothetical protein
LNKICRSIKILNAAFLGISMVMLMMATNCTIVPGNTEKDKIVIYFFFVRGCSYCEKAESFMEEISKNNPQLDIRKFEIYFNTKNLEIYQAFLDKMGLEPQGMPFIQIGDRKWFGFKESDKSEILSEVNFCIRSGCADIGKDWINGESLSETDFNPDKFGLPAFKTSNLDLKCVP